MRNREDIPIRKRGRHPPGRSPPLSPAPPKLGRTSADGGFKALAALPHWISTDNNLFKLFQPQRRTSVYFRVAVAGLGGGVMGALRIFATALIRFPLTTIVGGGPGVLLIVVAARDGSTLTKAVGIACGAILTVLLLLVALLARFVLGLGWALPRNGFGLCSGGAVSAARWAGSAPGFEASGRH